MIKQRMASLAIFLLAQSTLAIGSDCKPHALDTQFSPMQERNIVEDLSLLSAKGIIGIDEAVKYLGRPDRVEKSDGASIASWVFGQRRFYDFDDCHGTARIEYTVAYAILFLEQPRSSSSNNVVCKVREVTFMSEKMRPDPYEERADVVPGSLSVSRCEEFLAKQRR